MPVIKELVRKETDGTISFGNYELPQKTKLENYEYNGDLLKIKSFKEVTKLKRNGILVYESVPGTTVYHFKATDEEVTFSVEGLEDSQITLELESDTEYSVFINDVDLGKMKTNLGGKLMMSVEINEGVTLPVKIVKL